MPLFCDICRCLGINCLLFSTWGESRIWHFRNIMLSDNLTLLSSLLFWRGRSYVCQCALFSHTSGEGANNTDRHIWDGSPIHPLRPQQNGRNFPDDIFKCIFLKMKMYEFPLRFLWSLLPRSKLVIFEHWFSQWLGAGQPTSHCLDQWWLVYWPIYASLGFNESISTHQFRFSIIPITLCSNEIPNCRNDISLLQDICDHFAGLWFMHV